VYEVVKTVTTIYPNALLLDSAATSISRFIRSDSNNLKYIGIKGLAAIVKDYPKYAVDHQMAVIDCLEDRDETLKRKTVRNFSFCVYLLVSVDRNIFFFFGILF
jgi:AP-4 complex subunit epsilon-1